ncbi:MOSC domain-containing protein [uncultured Gimesia sp.]|uniref:MOSC domain-containing protein n=1 Tax=uncultured Gimesia sp. TaxID=1678688 RepID=UPI0026272CE2|nr:MOSC domain-containing protein [uncultured Gimesia sp.]
MIEALYIAKERNAPQEQVESIELVEGKGIVGDRYFGRSDYPGQQITFIEREEIESYNQRFEQNIDLCDTRRNVITHGVRLNDFVGKTFQIGEVKFMGVELCEPCATLGGRLENEAIQKTDVIKAFVNKGGLRADVLSSGCIKVGMRIE